MEVMRIARMDRLSLEMARPMIRWVCTWRTTWWCAVYKLKVMKDSSWWTRKAKSLTWTDSSSALRTPMSSRSYKKTAWMRIMMRTKIIRIIWIRTTYQMVWIKIKKRWCFSMTMMKLTNSNKWTKTNNLCETQTWLGVKAYECPLFFRCYFCLKTNDSIKS